MSARQATVVAILGVILAACSAGVEPTPSPPVSPTPSHGPSSPATVIPAPTAVAPSPTPVATAMPTPTPQPTPTPLAVPPRPSGLAYGRCCGEGNWEQVSSLSWEEPRTKGVEIRVYGVTKCFPPTDNGDELCLREGTELPADVRVLLAKGPATAGELSWFQTESNGDEVVGEGCTVAMLDKNGTPYYSVVVEAYSAAGPSIFAIADEGYYDSEGCSSATDD